MNYNFGDQASREPILSPLPFLSLSYFESHYNIFIDNQFSLYLLLTKVQLP